MKKIGILGAGQLGKMLIQDASKMGISLSLMDKSHDMPAVPICRNFTQGDIQNYEDVLAFGKDKDIVSIEIEAVNVDALEVLEKEGKEVYPQPHLLRIIKDKGLQKQYYKEHNLATSAFALYEGADEIRKAVAESSLSLPFVQKARTGGYDGKGVFLVRTQEDLNQLMPTPSVCEDLVDIDKELSVIIARNTKGETAVYEVAEMEFHPTANLVNLLFTPSRVGKEVQEEAKALALSLANQMEIVGLLAVELFLDKEGRIYINEVAPRPHNSGHHTIEGATSSQYENHIRAILGLPLGSTKVLKPAAMINLLGAEGSAGPTVYQGLEEALATEGAYLHLYGKAESKPHRKMGHATIIGDTLEDAIKKANFVRETISITGK